MISLFRFGLLCKSNDPEGDVGVLTVGKLKPSSVDLVDLVEVEVVDMSDILVEVLASSLVCSEPKKKRI
jgi:hypothetical protein